MPLSRWRRPPPRRPPKPGAAGPPPPAWAHLGQSALESLPPDPYALVDVPLVAFLPFHLGSPPGSTPALSSVSPAATVPAGVGTGPGRRGLAVFAASYVAMAPDSSETEPRAHLCVVFPDAHFSVPIGHLMEPASPQLQAAIALAPDAIFMAVSPEDRLRAVYEDASQVRDVQDQPVPPDVVQAWVNGASPNPQHYLARRLDYTAAGTYLPRVPLELDVDLSATSAVDLLLRADQPPPRPPFTGPGALPGGRVALPPPLDVAQASASTPVARARAHAAEEALGRQVDAGRAGRREVKQKESSRGSFLCLFKNS